MFQRVDDGGETGKFGTNRSQARISLPEDDWKVQKNPF